MDVSRFDVNWNVVEMDAPRFATTDSQQTQP